MPSRDSSARSVELVVAASPRHWAEVRRLFEEYAAGLEFGLEFQGFDRELADLPREYAEPGGCVVLALADAGAIACVGVRPLEGRICEMKRLYVIPAHRGGGLGRRLVERALREALGRGYERVRLDTVPSMRAARALYESLGFRVVEPYRYNPIAGTVYLELALEGTGPR